MQRLPLLIGVFPLLAPLLCAHDLITTTITWDREVARIVYERCASCHHPGGTAFSLMSYTEARPWAAAIKEDILRRRMPPWGAVKGFGEFRNDQALTPEQLEFITSWAEGGAPEGDLKDLPPAPKFAENPGLPPLEGALRASGGIKLKRAVLLDGVLPQDIPSNASLKIYAQFPDSSMHPLVWLQNYDARYQHVFLLRKPLSLPPGTMIYGLPENASLLLIPARPAAP